MNGKSSDEEQQKKAASSEDEMRSRQPLKKRANPAPVAENEESEEEPEAIRRRLALESDKLSLETDRLNRRRASKREYAKRNRMRQKMVLQSEASLRRENEQLRLELAETRLQLAQTRQMLETVQATSLDRNRALHRLVEQGSRHEAHGLPHGLTGASIYPNAPLANLRSILQQDQGLGGITHHAHNNSSNLTDLLSLSRNGYGANATSSNYDSLVSAAGLELRHPARSVSLPSSSSGEPSSDSSAHSTLLERLRMQTNHDYLARLDPFRAEGRDPGAPFIPSYLLPKGGTNKEQGRSQYEDADEQRLGPKSEEEGATQLKEQIDALRRMSGSN